MIVFARRGRLPAAACPAPGSLAVQLHLPGVGRRPGRPADEPVGGPPRAGAADPAPLRAALAEHCRSGPRLLRRLQHRPGTGGPGARRRPAGSCSPAPPTAPATGSPRRSPSEAAGLLPLTLVPWSTSDHQHLQRRRPPRGLRHRHERHRHRPGRRVGVGAAWGRVAPGVTSTPHQHDETETFVIVAGTGELVVDGQRHRVGRGTVIQFEPFETHVSRTPATRTWSSPRSTGATPSARRAARPVAAAPPLRRAPVFVFSTPPDPQRRPAPRPPVRPVPRRRRRSCASSG